MEVEALRANSLFKRATSQRKLFNYLAAYSFTGENRDLKEWEIGAALFGKKDGYDTNNDTVVRVNAHNLRDRLDKHYETAGRISRVIIKFPRGGFRLYAEYNPNSSMPILSDRAAQHVLTAKAAMNQRTPFGYELAFQHLDQALQEHSGHARLLALKALAHLNNAMYQLRHPRIELEAAERIISELRGRVDLPWEAWLADACIKQYLFWQWDQALASYDVAISLSHGEARYYQTWYPALLASQGVRINESVEILKTAVEEFAHSDVIMRGDLALHYILAGKFDEAAATIDASLALFPNNRNYTYVCLALLQEAKGNFEEAAATVQRIPVDSAEGPIVMGLRFAFIGLAGDIITARQGYEQLLDARKETYIPATQIATAALGCKDYDAAVHWLREGAVTEREPISIWCNILPFLRHVRGNADFNNLVTQTLRLHFADEPHASPFG